jgi:FixJ family two-component response regulator
MIFLVDDDYDFRKGIERLLKASGFNVQSYSSAEEFQADANLEEAACLVLDIHLTGMSGIDLRHRLLRSGSNIPVVFVTGKGSEPTQRAAEASGCIAYLEKPVSAGALVGAVREALLQR